MDECKGAETRGASTAPKKKRSRKREGLLTGIMKPTLISDELASFLNLPPGSEVARTHVTKEIHIYIKENDLKDANDARKILPDDSLKSLLGVENDEELSFFNLQKYLSSHFLTSKRE